MPLKYRRCPRRHVRVWGSLLLGLALCVPHKLMAESSSNIAGWREAVVSVTDLDAWEQTFKTVGAWAVIHQGEGLSAWLNAWQLPKSVTYDELLMGNPGSDSGYIRFVAFKGAQQRQIRSNGQTWETGGIFDLNVRVTNLDARFAELQARDWQGFADPVGFEFGPFVVREWLGRGPDGVVFALIQRVAPPLEGWPNLRRFSRSFNSTQIVRDLEDALAFYRDLLGFEIYVETKGPSDTPGPNVLGLPSNLHAQISRHTVIVHPQGINDGSIELIQFDGLTGRDFSTLAEPPNLGVLSLRFPVADLALLVQRLREAAYPVSYLGQAPLEPYGDVGLLILRGPNGEYLEFIEMPAG